MLTASTSEAYSLLFKLLADAGDEVLVPRPSYPLFDHLTRLDLRRARPYDLEYHGAWSIDFASLERALTPRTRAVLLVSARTTRPARSSSARRARSARGDLRAARHRASSPTRCSPTTSSSRARPARAGPRRGARRRAVVRARRAVEVGRAAAGEARMDRRRRSRSRSCRRRSSGSS